MTLSGPGGLILANENTFTGGLTVNGGTLTLAVPDVLADGNSLNVAAPHTLIFDSTAAPGTTGGDTPSNGPITVPEPGSLVLLSVGAVGHRRGSLAATGPAKLSRNYAVFR